MKNEYSSTWFDLFLSRIDDKKTAKEVQFILSQIRIGIDQMVLDIACGNGRHLRKLAAYGLDVVGIDINREMIKEAKQTIPDGTFYLMDMREINQLPALLSDNDNYIDFENSIDNGNEIDNNNSSIFDLIIIMWQSFGYFDQQTNRDILSKIFNLLRENGTFIIDIYNKSFFEKHQGVREISKDGRNIWETKFVKNNRLEVNLDYGMNMGEDTFTWMVYSKGEFVELLESVGFTVSLVCSDFDTNKTQEFADSPRIQYVAKK